MPASPIRQGGEQLGPTAVSLDLAIPWTRARPIAARVSASAWTQIGAAAMGVAVFVFLMMFAISPYYAGVGVRGGTETMFGDELDRSAPAILSHFDIPGVVVATVVNGSPSHTYAYGYANLEHHVPMTPDTVFRVASISKSLTAWGVLRLAERGDLDLDGPAERYLTPWPLAKSPFPTSAVTIRRLLNHTAGLNAGADTFRNPDQPARTTQDLLDRKISQGGAALVRPAGEAFEYSVPGYSLLQMILEDRTGQPFNGYMRDTVLRPLGMTSSSFEWDPSLRGRTATPYLDDGRPGAVTVPDDQAADSLFSTATDIARFIAAPLPDTRLPAGAHVLSARSVDQLFDRPVEIPSLQLAGLSADLPGLGYFVEKAPDQPDIVTNGGFDPGWSSRFYLVPGTGDGLAILTNSDRGQPVIAQIASIWSAWRGLPPSQMTRVYRVLGTDGVIAISLLATLAASLGANFALEFRAERRRRFGFHTRAVLASVVECGLVACAIGVWVFAHHGVITMPILNVVGSIVIAGFSLVALARLAYPLERPRQAAAP